jgi:hypothetical protein
MGKFKPNLIDVVALQEVKENSDGNSFHGNGMIDWS